MILHDLDWLVQQFKQSNGVLLLEAVAWHLDEANLDIYTDALLTGMGFRCEQLHAALYCDKLLSTSSAHIFFYKAFTVVCALHWACRHTNGVAHCIVIHTDNSNTVNVFNSLHAQGVYKELLKFAVNELMRYEVDLRVVCILGDYNIVADALL